MNKDTIQPAQELSTLPTAPEFAEHNPYAATLSEVSRAPAVGEVVLLPITYGARYHKRGSLRSGLFVATGLTLSITTIYVIGTSDPWPIAALGAVVTVSSMFTVGLLRPLLGHVVRRRNTAMQAQQRGETDSCPLWLTCIAVALTVTVALGFATLLQPRLANMLPAALMDFTGVFAVALPVLLLLSSYLATAYPFQLSGKYFHRAALAVLAFVILRGIIGLQ